MAEKKRDPHHLLTHVDWHPEPNGPVEIRYDYRLSRLMRCASKPFACRGRRCPKPCGQPFNEMNAETKSCQCCAYSYTKSPKNSTQGLCNAHDCHPHQSRPSDNPPPDKDVVTDYHGGRQGQARCE